MSRISQTNNLSQVDVISGDGQRMNWSPDRIRLGFCDLVSPVSTKSAKSLSSKKETVDDKQVLCGAEILREQLYTIESTRGPRSVLRSSIIVPVRY